MRWSLNVPDNLFVFEKTQDPDGVDRYTFFGKGWGHGVGFCQVGAYGMAFRGWTARADPEAVLHGDRDWPCRLRFAPQHQRRHRHATRRSIGDVGVEVEHVGVAVGVGAADDRRGCAARGSGCPRSTGSAALNLPNSFGRWRAKRLLDRLAAAGSSGSAGWPAVAAEAREERSCAGAPAACRRAWRSTNVTTGS